MQNSSAASVLLSIVALLVGFTAIVVAKTGPSHEKLVVCYISTWAVYRPEKGSYALDNFDPNLCTHAIYAFSGLDFQKSTIKSLDPWQDLKDNYGKGGYERLTSLKKSYPHLKVSLAIGGWNEGSTNYSSLAADPSKRQRFAKQALEFIKKYDFDGLDLDWEYPTQRGGKPADRENFVLLVKELRKEFKKHQLLLTSAFGASKKTIDEAYDVKALAPLLDYFHIMCYDYGGSWDRKVGANAPLTTDGFLSVEYSIEYFKTLGAPASKIVMGIPFYGRTFSTLLEGEYGDATDEKGFQGPYTREDGFMGYNEICSAVSNTTNNWKLSWHVESAQAIAREKDIETGVTRVVVYDSTRSVANKMRFAVRQSLAGAMVWSVDTDDFLGDCPIERETYKDFGNRPDIRLTIPKRVNSNYPLLRTMNEALLIAEDELEQEEKLNEQDTENEIPDDDEKKDDAGMSFVAAQPTKWAVGCAVTVIAMTTRIRLRY